MRSLAILLTIFGLISFSIASADVNQDLLSFAKKGYEEDVSELLGDLTNKVDINFQDADGNTALHHSALSNKPNVMKALKNSFPRGTGLKYSLLNRSGETALNIAIKNCPGCVDILLDLPKGTLDFTAGKISPLVAAVINGNDKVASKLINLGINTEGILIPYNDGSTVPLIQDIVTNSDMPGSLKLLLQKSRIVNSRNERNQTLLMQAVLSGRIENVKVLVESGASLSLRDGKGNTAMHLAAMSVGLYFKHLKGAYDGAIYTYLASRGGKTDIPNESSITPEQIFQVRKNFFAALKSLLVFFETHKGVDDQGRIYTIRSTSYIYGLSASSNSTSMNIYLNEPQNYSSDSNDLTVRLFGSLTFKVASTDEIDMMTKIMSAIKDFAMIYKSLDM